MSLLAIQVAHLVASQPPRRGATGVMIQRGLDTREVIFAAIVRAGEPIGAAEISRRTGLSREGVSKHVHALAAAGRIKRDGVRWVPASISGVHAL